MKFKIKEITFENGTIKYLPVVITGQIFKSEYPIRKRLLASTLGDVFYTRDTFKHGVTRDFIKKSYLNSLLEAESIIEEYKEWLNSSCDMATKSERYL
mgnify:FL=1